MLTLDEVVVAAGHSAGELRARPQQVTQSTSADQPRTGDLLLAGVQVHVPATYRADRPAGLLVMLHGAGGNAEQALWLVKQFAADENLIIVVPKSDEATWDVLRVGFGPDVAMIDGALAAVFAGYAIDPTRIAIGGFSDGASYALTLGLANGHLFRTILAFSPGFEAAPRSEGEPRIFISHGIDDRVLPIGRTSRRLVSALEQRRCDVTYYEFAGGHLVPAEALRQGFALLPRAQA